MPQLITVAQFARAHPAFSEASLRWRLHHARRNGLETSGAIIRDGRRILIDADKFLAYLKARQSRGPAAPL